MASSSAAASVYLLDIRQHQPAGCIADFVECLRRRTADQLQGFMPGRPSVAGCRQMGRQLIQFQQHQSEQLRRTIVEVGADAAQRALVDFSAPAMGLIDLPAQFRI